MKIGLVGKPSAGKSTFFKAATLADVDIANYPFTTIEPNTGVGHVKIDCVDKDLNTQCNPRTGFCTRHKRFIPIELIDVAGLVPDAHKGKGRGNQFLDDLREADVLIHVIDVSGSVNAHGEPVEQGSYDPAKDVSFLEEELDMWYLGILSKGWEKFARTIQQEGADVCRSLGKQLSGLGVDEDMVKDVMRKLSLPAAPTGWTMEHLLLLARELRLRTKPMVIAANKIDVPGAEKNYERIRREFPHYRIIACSAESELALREASKKGLVEYVPGEPDFMIKSGSALSAAQRSALQFIKERILEVRGSTGVQQVLDCAVFDVLGAIAVYPGGVGKLEDQHGRRLPDCFLMPAGSTALDFAYKLHTDFGKNFIRAIDVKTKRAVGKEHALCHRDVIEIISSR